MKYYKSPQTYRSQPILRCQPTPLDALQTPFVAPNPPFEQRTSACLHRVISPNIAQATRNAHAMLYEILGMAELIRVAFQKGELMSARERLSLLLTEATKLSSAFSDILQLPKLETETVVVAYERFDIVALLHEISEEARLMAGQKRLTVTDVSPPSPIIIQSDHFRISQIMTGLMSNAVKFTDRGRVTVIMCKDDDIIRLTVADTGRGMSEKQLSTLFGSSDGAPVDQTEANKTSGPALRIVKSMVKALGGTISASSRVGEGTIVEVSLPLKSMNERDAQAGRF